MSVILAQERATYEELWTSVADYSKHAPGELFLPIFLERAQPGRGDVTVLDAGTGSGKGALALHGKGFNVRMCDMTDAGLVEGAKALPFYHTCLWHDLYPATRAFGHPSVNQADYVYCTDVLEHVPPQFTMLAIDQMLRVTRKGLFLSVSLTKDEFGSWVGTSLHRTVESFVWWRDSIGEIGKVEEARDLWRTGTFWVTPR
jgi:2-polyprenyl-3-methyl-5-hydroxy-6-metoxy-1,4-benzoquinol methylase